MALFEVVLSQSYFNQQTINRFTYQGSGTPAAVTMSFALASALGAIPSAGIYPADHLITRLAGIQSNGAIFGNLSSRNLYSVTDFYDTPFVPELTGGVSGEGMSPAVAFGFRTNRVRTDVGRGMKRFVGVPESGAGTGGAVDVDSTGYVNLVAAMNEVLTYDDEGNTLTFTPIVCGKEKYEVEVDGVPTGRFAYRYYDTEAHQLEHTAVGVVWSMYDHVRTQVSRQYGHGN